MYMTIVFVLILAVCEATTTTDPPETPGTYSVCHLILGGEEGEVYCTGGEESREHRGTLALCITTNKQLCLEIEMLWHG